jgi:hypothetical protein
MTTKKQDKQGKKDLVLKSLRGKKTANEVIQNIWELDMDKGTKFVVENRGWKFYVHLNKLFARLERDGLISHVGMKKGEKLWAKNK